MRLQTLLAANGRVVERLFRAANAGRWPLERSAFADALRTSVEHRFRDGNATDHDVTAYLETLHAEDLALAVACAAGCDTAWEHFVSEYRPRLYAAARAIAGEDGARDLADSLYAELYGLTVGKEGRPQSLFRYFHGRSSLATWLRAVLAQRHVDGIRAGRRTDPLDDERIVVRDVHTAAPDPERARYVALLQEAVCQAIASLAPHDRLRLGYYYVQELTLAQIGRLTREHEATVSRKLDKTRRLIRSQVEKQLREEERLTDAQVQQCFAYASEAWPFDLTTVLRQSQ